MRRAAALLVLLSLAACAGTDGAPDGGSAGVPDVPPAPDGCVEDAPAGTVTTLPATGLRILLDPYGVAPLSALVAVPSVHRDCIREVVIHVAAEGAEPLDVALPFDDAYLRSYDDADLISENEFPVPILGLVAEAENQVRIDLVEDALVRRAELTIGTDALPPSLPDIEIPVREDALMEPGWNLVAFSAGENGFKPRPFVFDRDGRIRWLLRVDEAVSPGFVTPMEPLRNGNLLLAVGSTVYEYGFLGGELQRWLLPDGFEQHHDVFEMPSGNLLVCARRRDTPIVTGSGDEVDSSEDQVLEIDRGSGTLVNRWDLRRFLDVDRYDYLKTGDGNDWLHLNSVIYDSTDDSIIVSGKHQGMAKITRGGENPDAPEANKELRWILAPHKGWERAGADGTGMALTPYLLMAVDIDGAPYDDDVQAGLRSTEDFGWAYSQHAPALLADGSLFVFDNGGYRDLHRYDGEDFSRGVAFRIAENTDGVGGTVAQVWQYGRERGAELYDPVISDVDEGVVTGNRFVLPGSYTTRPDGTVGGAAKMVELRTADRRVVFEAHILLQGEEPWGDDICYRQERTSLY